MNEETRPGALSLQTLEQLGAQMPGGFLIYQADGTQALLYYNDVVLDIFGCATEAEFQRLTGGTFPGLVYPEDLAAVQNSIENQVAESSRQLDYVEYRIRRLDGAIRWVDDYGRYIQTPDAGGLYYVLLRDITDKHESMEENRRRAEVIQGLSADFDSIYLLDFDTGAMLPYRQRNRHFREIAAELGSEAPDWLAVCRSYAQRYVLPEDQMLYLEEFSETRIRERLAQEASYTVSYRVLEAGEDLPRDTQMSVVRIDGSGLYNHAVMGYRDVTEQVRRVRSETAEKLRIELELEKERRTHEAKSAFLFNISHDIRTPMNAIMGFTTLAMRHMDQPERLRDYLQKVDESNRLLAETVLTDAGFAVESVPDGCDAVDAVRDRPPGYFDLVLMDIQMPVMNGYEATRAIRALGRPDTDTLPIIALSANARDEDRRQSLESGMDSHVAKPFDVAKLLSTIREHLDARARPEPARECPPSAAPPSRGLVAAYDTLTI